MSALTGRRLYIVAYCTAAAALVWLIISAAIGGGLAASNPALALRWRPGDPQALTQLAQQALEAQKLPQARDYAREALAQSPHEATAWRLLGQVALASSNAPLAGQLFAQAGTLTQRDATLASWFFEDAVRRRRYADAVRYADVIIRRAPNKQSVMVFRLAALAQNPSAASALAQALSERPAWRQAFFRELGGSSDTAIIQVLDGLTARQAPLETDELSPLLLRLVKDGLPQEAYSLWRTVLPPADRPAGLVYDPTFTRPLAPSPFGWYLDEGADGGGHLATPGEQPGLHVDMQGMGSQRIVMQRLLLPPGHYRFDTAARLIEGDPLTLVWAIGCPRQPPVTLQLAPGVTARSSTEFEVGPNCPIQILLLLADARDHATPASALVQLADVRELR